MKKILSMFAFLAASGLAGCALFTPKNIDTALNVAQYACVIANAELGSPAISDACGIEKALIPLIDVLVADFKLKQSQMMAQQLMESMQQHASTHPCTPAK
jgi:hypothetical protein